MSKYNHFTDNPLPEFEGYFDDLAKCFQLKTYKSIPNFEIFAWQFVNLEDWKKEHLEIAKFVPSHLVASLKDLTARQKKWISKSSLISRTDWLQIYEDFRTGPQESLRNMISDLDFEMHGDDGYPSIDELDAWLLLRRDGLNVPPKYTTIFEKMRLISSEIHGWIDSYSYFPFIIWEKEVALQIKKSKKPQ